MGWLWTSAEPPPREPPAPTSSSRAEDSAAPKTTSPRAGSSSAPPADPEVEKLLDFFRADSSAAAAPDATKASAAPPEQQGSETPSSWLSALRSKPASAPPPLPPGDAVSESLLPTDMSCRQAFDLAWYCNSLGGQFNAVYRYGTMRSCSPLWDDFWFCMRVKSYSGQLRHEAIREHYRRKEHAKYAPGLPSSEDVWEPRAAKLAPGSAFSEALDAPTISDDEWRRMELERRQKIRQQLENETPT